MNIKEKVYKFKTKYKEGFIQSEIDDLLKEFPNIDMDKFSNALQGITCMMSENKVIIYRHDVLTALSSGIRKHDLHLYEWD